MKKINAFKAMLFATIVLTFSAQAKDYELFNVSYDPTREQ